MNNVTRHINRVKQVVMLLVCAVSMTFLSSCGDDLDIQLSYPFTVETMPVPKELATGETAEIRCQLKREGDFAGTVYTIRYFQYDGEGTLNLDNGLVFQPNDRYLLQDEKFRLYYTSNSDESQSFIVVIEDNFGNSQTLEFDFNAATDDEEGTDDGNEVIPIWKGGVLSEVY